jgi:hypothetical protein
MAELCKPGCACPDCLAAQEAETERLGPRFRYVAKPKAEHEPVKTGDRCEHHYDANEESENKWVAWDDYDPTSPVGTGPTEADAIDDLFLQARGGL